MLRKVENIHSVLLGYTLNIQNENINSDKLVRCSKLCIKKP